jgi:hypothetical protein
VSHAGLVLLRELADRTRLTAGLSAALPSPAGGHDRGRVFADLACAIGDGAQVVRGRGGIDVPGGDEVGFSDQRLVHGPFGDDPSAGQTCSYSFQAWVGAGLRGPHAIRLVMVL